MNVAAVSLLNAAPIARTWYRAANPQYLPSAIATSHTRATVSRFYDPHSANPQFSSLYLCDSPMVALFEAQAMFGSPTTPGGTAPAPTGAWVVLSVQVQLNAVVDISDVKSQAILFASAQELTGDWRGYAQRSMITNVTGPIGTAPTQALGEAVHKDPRRLEGLVTLSAKVPYHQNLIVFADQLGATSFVEYSWSDCGVVKRYRVDQANPNGYQIP